MAGIKMGFSQSVHEELMVKASYYYYEKDMTQTEIAQLLGVSRLTLGRLLKEARNNGIVRIEIANPRNLRHLLELEDRLNKNYGLTASVVADYVPGSRQNRAEKVALEASKFFSRNIRSGMKISLAWGKTLSLMVDALPTDKSITDLEVMTLMGGAGTTETYIQPERLAADLLTKYSGSGYVINAPFFCNSPEVCRSLKEERTVSEVLRRSAESDLTYVGIGEKPSLQFNYWARQLYDQATMKSIIDSGAVGDICGTYINADGVPCCPEISDRLVNIDIETLKAHKKVVALAAGSNKLESIYAAICGGYIDVLITDKETAEELCRL